MATLDDREVPVAAGATVYVPQAVSCQEQIGEPVHARAWYEKQGPAREVLRVGVMADPTPGAGEVRIRIAASGINPGDIKKRQNAFGYGMPYPRVIPHSDGAGHVDLVGEGVAADWIARRVWCYGAQSYRAFGTAAEYTVVPASQVVPLPDGVSFEQGACLGIGYHRTSLCSCSGSGRRADRSGTGCCRRGGNLRAAIGQPCRRDGDWRGPFFGGRIRCAERRSAPRRAG